MRHSRTAFAAVCALLALSTLAACASPAPTASPSATPCASPDVVKDSPDTANAVKDRYKYGRTTLTSVLAHASHSGCDRAIITRIDFELGITVHDITAPTQLSIPASIVIAALDEVAPDLPGDVTLNFESTGQTVTLAFTRDQARQAVASHADGVPLLTALGYPGKPAAGASCVSLPGKQPLADLTRQAQAELASDDPVYSNIGISVNGAWCGGQFTPRQTEIHVLIGWPYQPPDLYVMLGDEAGKALDRLGPLAARKLPGDLPPRLVLVSSDWVTSFTTVIPLNKALELRKSGLQGRRLYRALGFPPPT